LYIGVGSFGHVGDCGEMLGHGSHFWQLWLFGALTTPLGLYLWHGQGKHFGLGPAPHPVSRGAAYTTCAIFLALLVLEIVLSGRK
jgi:hypothetical protein